MRRALLLLPVLAALSSVVVVVVANGQTLPFTTAASQILDRNGTPFYYAGANWPGHLEAMIPEGLQYASIPSIFSQLTSLGLNGIRLTYATEMVDDLADSGGGDPRRGRDVGLNATLVGALGVENGTRVLGEILAAQDGLGWTGETTRLEVFDAVASEAARWGVVVHLDNHVSGAGWCCFPGDGNGWFGEPSFDVGNWTRGWSFMAQRAGEKWSSFASVGLRNELRSPLQNSFAAEPYDWYTWYEHMTDAAAAVHTAAPDVLIFFGGLESDTDMSKIPTNQSLDGTILTSTWGKSVNFVPSALPYANKIVLEIHKYDDLVIPYAGDCGSWASNEYGKGFQALNSSDPSAAYQFPVVMTEWGFAQDDSTYQKPYPQCLAQFTEQQKFGWLQWAIQGSYYLRQGTQDADEGWGLLNHDWSSVRSQVTVQNITDRMTTAIS